jgi:S-DNA-T family DNA segregation ATPase FtsK/SpoIIIE
MQGLILPVIELVVWLVVWFLSPWHLIMTALLVVVFHRLAADLVRFAYAPRAAKAHYLGMVRARHRWHWLSRCTGLALPELARKNRPGIESHRGLLVLWVLFKPLRGILAPVVGIEAVEGEKAGRVHYPRTRHWRLTEWGWSFSVKTAPRVGRKEFDKQAVHLADYWRAYRVGITQVAPGRLVVRSLRRDPLADSFGPDQCPPGTFAARRPDRLYLGRDDFGAHRELDLRGVTGIVVSGLPGYGKTSLISSWLCQLAGTAACQAALLDGKDGGDHVDWHPRAWRHAGDDLRDALGVLEDVHAEMRRRLREVAQLTGQRNAWNAGGPSEALPLLLTVIDECQAFLDLQQYKGDPKSEVMARRCIALVGQLIRKGRSVLCLTILATQKTTGDSIPTSLRDNSALAVSFALKTNESAVAALGDDIREYQGYSPTLLRGMPGGIGTAVVTLPSGQDPFCRLRVPLVSEDWAARRAVETAHLMRDPGKIGAVTGAPESVPVNA